jgi:hypothetical protein
VKLSWPTTAPSFGLETLPDLGELAEGMGWPAHVANGRFVSTNQITGETDRYFRLALPRP